MSLEALKKEIKSTSTLEGLRHLYQKYGGMKQKIMPFIMERKSEIENTSQIIDEKQIIKTKTRQNNGIDSSESASDQ